MSITSKFLLSHSSNIYYSGEQIVGLLKICCLKKYQLDVILLEFYGHSVVQWWELDKSGENITHNDLSSHEVSSKSFCSQQQQHIRQQLKLNLPPNRELQPHVEYTFEFVFQVPQQVPASCNCFYGHTEYGLRLQVKRKRKVDKEVCKRIIIKNKLDLTQEIIYQKACSAQSFNGFGEIALQLPCSGFTPGQRIPYHLKYRTVETYCKLLIEFNCYTTCCMHSNSNKFKQIKRTINKQKLQSAEISSFVNIPLHCHSSTVNRPEWLIKREYLLEVLLVNSKKQILLRTAIPLIIGTTPCFASAGDLESFMCFNNCGLALEETHNQLNARNILDQSLLAANKISAIAEEQTQFR